MTDTIRKMPTSHPGRRGYPPELQARAVGLCFFGLSFVEVAQRLDVSCVSVGKWWRDPQVRAAAAAAAAAAGSAKAA